MNRNSKKEIFWVLGAFLVALGMAVLMVNENVFAKEIMEVQLYDVYFVLDLWFLTLALFLGILLITYLIKEGLGKFRQIIPNIILSICIIGNILILSYCIHFLTSAHSHLAEAQEPLFNPIFNTLRTLIVVQFLLLAGLFLLGIRTGVLSKRQKSSPTIGWRS